MKLKNPVLIGVCFPALAPPIMQRRKRSEAVNMATILFCVPGALFMLAFAAFIADYFIW
jgi:hypothetical protein